MTKFNQIIPSNISEETIAAAKAAWYAAAKKYETAAAAMEQQQKITKSVRAFFQVTQSTPEHQSQMNDACAAYFFAIGDEIDSSNNLYGLKMDAMTKESEYLGHLLQKAAWQEKIKNKTQAVLKNVVGSPSEIQTIDALSSAQPHIKDQVILPTPPNRHHRYLATASSNASPLMKVFQMSLDLQAHVMTIQQLVSQLRVDKATQQDIGDVLSWTREFTDRLIARMDNQQT